MPPVWWHNSPHSPETIHHTKNLKPVTPSEFRPWFPNPSSHLIATTNTFYCGSICIGLGVGGGRFDYPLPSESNQILPQISTKQPTHKVNDKVKGLKYERRVQKDSIYEYNNLCYYSIEYWRNWWHILYTSRIIIQKATLYKIYIKGLKSWHFCFFKFCTVLRKAIKTNSTDFNFYSIILLFKFIPENNFLQFKKSTFYYFLVWRFSSHLKRLSAREGVIIECPLNGQFHNRGDVIITSWMAVSNNFITVTVIQNIDNHAFPCYLGHFGIYKDWTWKEI